jgi:hypothetical protein
MSLRDWFAGQALISIMVGKQCAVTNQEHAAQLAYELADAMLAQRQKEVGK